MNIITNYPVQYSNTIQNKNSVKAKENSSIVCQNNNVSFKGRIPNFLKPQQYRTVKMDSELRDYLGELSVILDYDEDKLVKMVKGRTVRSLDFLSAMAERFNATNWGKKSAERENPQIIIDLFERIKQPDKRHIGFVENVRLDMTHIKKCFDLCDDKPKELSKFSSTYDKLRKTRREENYMIQILNSPNSREYIENIDTYLPHLGSFKDPKGVIENLDKQMAANNVDLVSNLVQEDFGFLFAKLPETPALTKEMLMSDYSSERVHLINALNTKLGFTKEYLEAGDAVGIKKIYKSTTKDNYEFRADFLDTNYDNFGRREKYRKDEVNEIAALFELADKVPTVKKFLTKMNEQKGSIPAGGYLRLIEELGPEYLLQNADKISTYTLNNVSRVDRIIECAKKDEGKIINRVLNPIRSIFGKKPIRRTPVFDIVQIDSAHTIEPKRAEQVKIPYIKPLTLTKEPDGTVKVFEPVITETEKPAKAKRSYIFKPYVPKQPNAKKLLVINDVNKIIERKLGSKVLEEQSGIYADKATKIRLSVLPEIFESIKETRAAERAKGVFSKSKSASNEDAIDLYTRVNGKNKKLVNYLLKVRNADGTRKYNVKDIIEILTDANKEIIQGQNKSTKLNRFTAKDERAIYDRIFDEKLALYGKLPRKTSKKS